MKKIVFLPVLFLIITSCASIRVNADYDKKVDFSQYKTFAFYKSGIDKMDISDLDKRRILHAIDEVMTAKGYTKSDAPDLLVNVFTKEREQIDVNNWGYGWGWRPYMWGNHVSTYRYTEGTLYIDLIDAKKKELVWQGEGEGVLTKDTHKKDEKIKEFVTAILAQYPPQKK